MKIWFIIPILCLCLIACEPTEPSKEASRPNIIYIIADDLGYGDLGVYGQTLITTPNIDQLAAGGMRFTQHYSGSTVCAPSRAVLMTGKHTGHTVVRGNREIKPEGQFPMADSVYTLAEMFREAGYSTAAFGKWGLGFPGSEGDPNRQGFDTFFGYNCQRHAHTYYPDYLWSNQTKAGIMENADGKQQVHSADLIQEQILHYLRGRGRIDASVERQPFFLFLPMTMPHAALQIPEEYRASYEGKFEEIPQPDGYYPGVEKPKSTFAAMVSTVDAHVGQIVQLLDSMGIRENTLIMFTSDNGPHEEGGADPAFFDSNGPYRGVKRDLYEGGVRVPFIANWPGKISSGTTSDHVSAFWDIFPTMAEIIEVNKPEGTDGLSLVPTLMGEENQEVHGHLYWEFHEQGGKQAVRQGKWKGVRLNVGKDPEPVLELYDLEKDPGETQNLAEEFPEKMAELTALMENSHEKDVNWPLYYADRQKTTE
ncbi:MAG: arylsulfatase [Bacteroidota bacterium]